MKQLIEAIRRRWFDNEQAHVLLRFEDGGGKMVGPMDKYAAEVYLVSVLAPSPYYSGRRVVRARLVL